MSHDFVTSGIEDLAAQTEELERARAALDARAAELAAANANAPAVIDPDGAEYELDEKGAVLKAEDGTPVPKWTHDTVDLKGRTIQAKKPQTAALMAFTMATSKYTTAKVQNDMVALFVRNHISDRSYNDLLVAMMDPDDSFTMEDFGELMRLIATLGTARPTEPSRS